MGQLRTSYDLIKPPAPAMSWEEYKQIVEEEWTRMLAPGGPTAERAFQSFFELHPCMLPVIGGGHHGLFPGAVISQPKLPNLEQSIPDFLVITRDSASIYAQFIEIEATGRSWATKAGEPSGDFKHAVDQIKTWKAWLSDPSNVMQFQQTYRMPGYGGRTLVPRYVLIYGRRCDPSLTQAFTKKRHHLQAHDEIFMTYDRLRASETLAMALTVRLDRRGYRAISVPPTVRLNPMDAEDWAIIRDKDKAVQRNEYLSPVRRAFLLERWPYWDGWAKRTKVGVASLGDFE